MAIFTFILGLIIGIGFMIGVERYRLFKNEEAKRAAEMDEILTRFKAIELNKEEKR